MKKKVLFFVAGLCLAVSVNAQWLQTGDLVYTDKKVGIGVPSNVNLQCLSVYRALQISSVNTTEQAGICKLDFLASTGWPLETYYGSGYSLQYDPSNSSFNILQRVNPLGGEGIINNVFSINSLGNIGIGTTVPYSKISFGQPSFNNPVSRFAIAETAEGKYFYGIGGYIEDSNDPMTAGLGLWGGTENQTPWDGSNGVKPHIFIKRVNGNIGIGITSPNSQLHLASDADHSFRITRASGMYGFRIYRNASEGNIYFQNTDNNNSFGTRIKIGEGGANWQNLYLNPDGGNVLIGKTTQVNSEYKLDVAGALRADKIRCNTTGADFVFEPGYQLMPLAEVESYVKANKRLPGIAPAATMKAEGTDIGELQTKLLQKVEELTLYSIEQEKKNAELLAKYNALLEKVETLTKTVEKKQN